MMIHMRVNRAKLDFWKYRRRKMNFRLSQGRIEKEQLPDLGHDREPDPDKAVTQAQ